MFVALRSGWTELDPGSCLASCWGVAVDSVLRSPFYLVLVARIQMMVFIRNNDTLCEDDLGTTLTFAHKTRWSKWSLPVDNDNQEVYWGQALQTLQDLAYWTRIPPSPTHGRGWTWGVAPNPISSISPWRLFQQGENSTRSHCLVEDVY